MKLLRVVYSFVRAKHARSISHGSHEAAIASPKVVDRTPAAHICPAERLFSPIPPPVWKSVEALNMQSSPDRTSTYRLSPAQQQQQEQQRHQPQLSFLMYPRELIDEGVIQEAQEQAEKLQAARTARGQAMSQAEYQRFTDPANAVELWFALWLEAGSSYQSAIEQFETAKAKGSAEVARCHQTLQQAQAHENEAYDEYQGLVLALLEYYEAAAAEVRQLKVYQQVLGGNFQVRYK